MNTFHSLRWILGDSVNQSLDIILLFINGLVPSHFYVVYDVYFVTFCVTMNIVSVCFINNLLLLTEHGQ